MKKKIMLGTSDAWSTSRSSHRPREPGYYIEDCRIFATSKNIPSTTWLLPYFTALFRQVSTSICLIEKRKESEMQKEDFFLPQSILLLIF